MPRAISSNSTGFDRTNALLAFALFVFSFIIYAMTVQRSFSFWDCGEFIACAAILGIPHPPGTPLFILLGRIASMIPFVEDISHRINYLSVIGSAFTAMFSYLLGVRLIGYFFGDQRNEGINKFIAYIGGLSGGMFVAFSRTNWANSVEAEVYGMALALSVAIVWLTIRFFEQRGTMAATRTMIFIFYIAILGLGLHMTVFLVVPVCAVFFVLKRGATTSDWAYVCGFAITEVLLVFLISNIGIKNAHVPFSLISILLAAAVLFKIRRSANWALLIAIVSVATVMQSFSTYFMATPMALALIILLAVMAKKYRWQLHWRSGLAIILAAFIGLSVHLFIPIRSTQNPRIDENNPSRDWSTFVDFLDRKQYGSISMVERMFKRRGSTANQFGRHPHMGYWSYFEEQYSRTGWNFIFPFFILGMIGMYVAIKKRLEIGLPFFTLFLLCSIGLVLYMNFADGTRFSSITGDAYLEVRNRDYFFTPAFVFFGIAMGLGVAAVMQYLMNWMNQKNPAMARPLTIASSVMVLLPAVTLAHNYHACDRSQNFIPYNYAANLLDTCEPNAILFTSGDNDTFPLWCMQEAYNYRRDVRIVNLSLLNTDWYVAQMKNRFGVPISLSDEQIVWEKLQIGTTLASRPAKPFNDRARRRQTYLVPQPYGGRVVKVQDMMVDEIVIESIVKDSGDTWHLKQPIYFSSQPYAESPLKLRTLVNSVGLLYKLEPKPHERKIDVDTGYDLYMNSYNFGGYESSAVYRDENATGVFLSVGINATRIFNELQTTGQYDKAISLATKMIDSYPEYWQTYLLLGDLLARQGDSTAADSLNQKLHDTLLAFVASNEENLYYLQDLGLAKAEIGRRTGDQAMLEDGLDLLWKAFNANSNSGYAFQKLYTVLAQNGRIAEVRIAAEKFAEYKMNLNNPILKQLLGITPQTPRLSP